MRGKPYQRAFTQNYNIHRASFIEKCSYQQSHTFRVCFQLCVTMSCAMCFTIIRHIVSDSDKKLFDKEVSVKNSFNVRFYSHQ